MLYVFFGSLIFSILPAIGFHYLEGWRLLDAWYFTIITLTTGTFDQICLIIMIQSLWLKSDFIPKNQIEAYSLAPSQSWPIKKRVWSSNLRTQFIISVGFGDYAPSFHEGEEDASSLLKFFLEIYRTIVLGEFYPIFRQKPPNISFSLDVGWSRLAWWIDLNDFWIIGWIADDHACWTDCCWT